VFVLILMLQNCCYKAGVKWVHNKNKGYMLVVGCVAKERANSCLLF